MEQSNNFDNIDISKSRQLTFRFNKPNNDILSETKIERS
jgi:hypothetical protein